MLASLRPRRSALFVPGSNARALDKAISVAADVLILDLEDAVGPDQKDTARAAVAAALPALTTGRREIVVRVNGLDTPWVARDIAAMVAARPDAILVPKISRTDDLRRARTAVAAAQAPEDLSLWAMIETPAAIINAAAMGAIAAMPTPAVTCYVLGTNDLAAGIGAHVRPGRTALVPHLAQAIVAARAHGLAVLDGTFNDLLDESGLRAECVESRDMGMDGKTLIHPGQVAVANEVFAPSGQEIAWARKVIEAFAKPDNAGKGVIKVAGRMVERLHERQARRRWSSPRPSPRWPRTLPQPAPADTLATAALILNQRIKSRRADFNRRAQAGAPTRVFAAAAIRSEPRASRCIGAWGARRAISADPPKLPQRLRFFRPLESDW